MRGWKTILVGVAALLTAAGAYFTGAMELQEAIKSVFAALVVIFAAMKGNDIKEAILKNGK